MAASLRRNAQLYFHSVDPPIVKRQLRQQYRVLAVEWICLALRGGPYPLPRNARGGVEWAADGFWPDLAAIRGCETTVDSEYHGSLKGGPAQRRLNRAVSILAVPVRSPASDAGLYHCGGKVAKPRILL